MEDLLCALFSQALSAQRRSEGGASENVNIFLLRGWSEYSRTCLKSNIQQLKPRRLFKMGDEEPSSDGSFMEMQLLFWRPISLPSFQDG